MGRHSKENPFSPEDPQDNFSVTVVDAKRFFISAIRQFDNYENVVFPITGKTGTQLDGAFLSNEATNLYLFEKETDQSLEMTIMSSLYLSEQGAERTWGGVFTHADVASIQDRLMSRSIISGVSDGDRELHLMILNQGLEMQVVFPKDYDSGKPRTIQLFLMEIKADLLDQNSSIDEISTFPKVRNPSHFEKLMESFALLYAHLLNALYAQYRLQIYPLIPLEIKLCDGPAESNSKSDSKPASIEDILREQLKEPEKLAPTSKKLTFDDVVCQDAAVWEAKKMVREMNRGVRKSITGTDPIKSYLMVGEPGVGKTRLARVIADQSGAEFVSIGVEDISQGNAMWYGQAENNLKEKLNSAVDLATKGKKVVLFLDEFDTFVPNRGRGHEVSQRIIQILLTYIEKFHQNPNVFILAASNNEESIDPALKRAGRMDQLIQFYPFDTKEKRKTMLLYFAGCIKARSSVQNFAANVDWDAIAEITEGMSMGMNGTAITNGPDLDKLLNGAVEDKKAKLEILCQASLDDYPDLWQPVTTEEIIDMALRSKKTRVGGKQKRSLGFNRS